MITCKDCKFWTAVGAMRAPQNGWRRCVLMNGTLKESKRVNESGSNGAHVAYCYDLETGPDFGCVLGEPKE